MSRFRAEFPVADAWSYLNHAAHGPFSRRTIAALDGVAQQFAVPPEMDAAQREGAITQARANIAALVNGDEQSVAFVSSLADALSLCAAGLDWRSGDNVVIPGDEFPSVVYPFMNLQGQGVELRLVPKGPSGFTDLSAVEAAMDDRTRALVISQVEFMDGFRHDLTAIGRICRDHDVLSLVDATQSMGPLPIDIQASGIDVIAAHAYKWLMASFGLGVMHFSTRALDEIRPVYVGRLSVTKGFEDLDYGLDWRPGAQRFQTGAMNWLSLAALNASCELVRGADPAWTEQHTLRLTDRLLAGVAELGYQPSSSLDPAHRSQIVSFSSGDRAFDQQLVRLLHERKVAVSLRGRGLRVSPYFYNDDGDIDRLLETLPRR